MPVERVPEGGFTTDLYVYVVRAQNGGIKIGVTGTPMSRITNIRARSCKTARIVALWERPDAFDVEHHTHVRLEHKKLHGEWFDVSIPEACAVIAQVMADLDQKIVRTLMQYRLPRPKRLTNEEDPHLIGYARDFGSVPLAIQRRWLASYHIDPLSVHQDLTARHSAAFNCALDEMGEFSIFLAWSPAVLGGAAAARLKAAADQKKGARIVFAHQR